MAIRWYLLPVETVGTARGPKYLNWRFNNTGLAVTWGWMDYGLEPAAVVWADVTTQQHNSLAGNADVLAAPANIDNNLTSGAVSTVSAFLEGMNIPGNWVATAFTYREVLRLVAGLFQFAQAWAGNGGGLIFTEGRDLGTTYGSLGATVQQRILDTAAGLGYDTTFITASTTLRELLRNFGQQWGARPLLMGAQSL